MSDVNYENEKFIASGAISTESEPNPTTVAQYFMKKICDVLSGYSSVISINIYARCGRISFEFYSESEGGAESGLDPYELMELCESRGCELTVEEDMTGSMHLAVSFDHIDIGTVGFKSTPRIVRGDR